MKKKSKDNYQLKSFNKKSKISNLNQKKLAQKNNKSKKKMKCFFYFNL